MTSVHLKTSFFIGVRGHSSETTPGNPHKMTSFWKYLCLPNKRARMRTEQRRNWQNLNAQQSLSEQSGKQRLLEDNQDIFFDDDLLPANESDTWVQRNNQACVKKRRTVREVFDTSFKADESRRVSHYSMNNAFGTSPGMAPNLESMYGYTPRAVQEVMASKALEGGAIEDYFADCRNDNVLEKFATAERCNKYIEPTLPPVTRTTYTTSTSVETRRGKYIVDSEGWSSADSDTDNENDNDFLKQFPTHTNSSHHSDAWSNRNSLKTNGKSPYMCQSESSGFQNQHFDEIFGGYSGEVLY